MKNLQKTCKFFTQNSFYLLLFYHRVSDTLCARDDVGYRNAQSGYTIILKTKAAGARPTALYKRNGCGAWCNRAYMPLGLVSQDARLSENSHSCCKDRHISLIFQTFEQRIQRKMLFSFDESWKSSAKAKLFPTFFYFEGIITNIICTFAVGSGRNPD